MCFGCSKEPSHQDGSFEYPQHMFWLRNKKNNFQLCILIWGPGSGKRFNMYSQSRVWLFWYQNDTDLVFYLSVSAWFTFLIGYYDLTIHIPSHAPLFSMVLILDIFISRFIPISLWHLWDFNDKMPIRIEVKSGQILIFDNLKLEFMVYSKGSFKRRLNVKSAMSRLPDKDNSAVRVR